MIRKLLIGAPLAGLLLLGATARTNALPAGHTAKLNADTKSVSGKVISIGDDRRSFSLEVDEGSTKKTMQFVLDDKTQVQGRVTQGTVARVEYQPMSDGKNLAVSVTAQS